MSSSHLPTSMFVFYCFHSFFLAFVFHQSNGVVIFCILHIIDNSITNRSDWVKILYNNLFGNTRTCEQSFRINSRFDSFRFDSIRCLILHLLHVPRFQLQCYYVRYAAVHVRSKPKNQIELSRGLYQRLRTIIDSGKTTQGSSLNLKN